MRLHSLSTPGDVTIRLKATLGGKEYTSAITISVVDPLTLIQPDLLPIVHSAANQLLLSPHSSVQLLVNRLFELSKQ